MPPLRLLSSLFLLCRYVFPWAKNGTRPKIGTPGAPPRSGAGEQVAEAVEPLEHVGRAEDERLRSPLGSRALDLVPAHGSRDRRIGEPAERIRRDRLSRDVVLKPVHEHLARAQLAPHLGDDLVGPLLGEALGQALRQRLGVERLPPRPGGGEAERRPPTRP